MTLSSSRATMAIALSGALSLPLAVQAEVNDDIPNYSDKLYGQQDAAALAQAWAKCVMGKKGAGLGAGFTDEDYTAAGAALADVPVLTVYAGDYVVSEWGPGPKIEEMFEAECGCDLQFKPGDLLVTSGIGGIYQPNIPVAVVVRVQGEIAWGFPLANPSRTDAVVVERAFEEVVTRTDPVDAATEVAPANAMAAP